MNPELSEADLCHIEANYGDTLSALEKALITELRATRKLAEENEEAGNQVVELRREVRDLEDRLEEAQDQASISEKKIVELQHELDKLEDAANERLVGEDA